MAEIIITTGFLGSGKTTFLLELLKKRDPSKSYALIENEFGKENIDSEIISSSNLKIREITQGCICCSLVGDFADAITELLHDYAPDVILIEPSGVAETGPLVNNLIDLHEDTRIADVINIVDTPNHALYNRNFKKFYQEQIEKADKIFLSKLDLAGEEITKDVLESLQEANPDAVLYTEPFPSLQYEDMVSFRVYHGEDFVGEHHSEEHEHHAHHHGHSTDFEELTLTMDKVFSPKDLKRIEKHLNPEEFPTVNRVKGFVKSEDGIKKIDYVTGQLNITDFHDTDKLVLVTIGKNLDTEALEQLFLGE